MRGNRLVIGAGATGRTHLLRSWVSEAGLASSSTVVSPEGSAIWLTGSPLRTVTGADVAAARAGRPAMLVADDLQWFDGDALAQLVDAASAPAGVESGADVAVVASRRPADGTEPAPDALELLTEVLTRTEPAHRMGLLDLDAFAPVVAALRAGRASRSGGPAGALNTAELAALHAATAGSVGLAADLIATGWTPGDGPPGAETVEAVVSRVRRAGPAAADLARLWSLIDPDDVEGRPEAELALALRALGQPVRSEGHRAAPPSLDIAERAARAGGLLAGDGALIPVVRAALATDLTATQRGSGHDRLAAVLAGTDPPAAARHLLVGDGQIPDAARLLAGAALGAAGGEPDLFADLVERAERLGLAPSEASVLRALGAFHRGSADALVHLERAEWTQDVSGGEEPLDDRTVALGYGLDLRDLRLASAAARPLAGPLAAPLHSVALVLAGRPPVPPGDGAAAARPVPLGRVLGTVAGAVDDLARGDQRNALAGLVQAADDFDRLHPTAPLGFTPHGVGALAALLTGDLVAVEHLCSQAVAHGSGGPGEDLFHHLVRAYGRLVRGDYRSALELGRRHRRPDLLAGAFNFGEGDTDGTDLTDQVGSPSVDALGLPQRDRLVLAALEAAIARRSGDTSRLRASWQAAEQALLRPSTTWLLLDVFTELLAAGARLGDRRRVDPVVAELTDQALALPPTGPGPAAGWWLRLQVALAGEDNRAVAEAAAALSGLAPTDERSQARAQAGAVWAGIVIGQAAESDVVAASERMSAVGDGWEASRLLGQAALDEADPRVARRLLEMARVSASEPVETSGDDALVALGLSDREAEVALMVVEGRTHKEIGAQLFISPKTVEHHVAKIRQKLGATSRAELVASIRAAAGGS
ncbi:MAG: LuxR C-terminal-related transcriptional regulator [Acidimicrobiales bacterium]